MNFKQHELNSTQLIKHIKNYINDLMNNNL